MGVGLILQNHFNGEKANNTMLTELMKNYNMPLRPEDAGIEKNNNTFDLYYEKLCASSAIENDYEAKKLTKSLEYLWNI